MKKWDFQEWMSEVQKEAESVKERKISADEIQKYSVDEALPDVERAAFLLKSVFAVQRAAVVPTLPLLVAVYRETAVEQLFPLLLVYTIAPSLIIRSRVDSLSLLCVCLFVF